MQAGDVIAMSSTTDVDGEWVGVDVFKDKKTIFGCKERLHTQEFPTLTRNIRTFNAI